MLSNLELDNGLEILGNVEDLCLVRRAPNTLVFVIRCVTTAQGLVKVCGGPSFFVVMSVKPSPVTSFFALAAANARGLGPILADNYYDNF